MRGRKPTPTHLKLLRGLPGHRPIVPEPEPAVPPDIPEAPAWLMPRAKEEWERIAGELYRLGCLTVVDINCLGLYCQAFAHMLNAEEALARMREKDPVMGAVLLKTHNGSPALNPLWIAARQAANNMVRFASEFGLSPAARARIAAGPIQVGRPKFAGLLGGDDMDAS